ncbi:hypothetical protein [Corynebacterium deserti]|nr:hypothetical protein [Corynebacterium deserti]
MIKPQAINAPMLGMIIEDRKVPNFFTATLAPHLLGGALVVVDIS